MFNIFVDDGIFRVRIPCVNAFAPALEGGVAKELVPKYGCSPRSQKLVSFLATFFKRSASSPIYAEIFTQGDGVGLGWAQGSIGLRAAQ